MAVDFKDYIVVFGDKDEVTEEPPCGLWYLKEEFRGFELMRQKEIRDIYADESNFVFNGEYVQGLPHGQSFTEGAKYDGRFWIMKRDLKNGYTFIPLIQKSLDSIKGSQFFDYISTNDGQLLEDKARVLLSGYYLDKYSKTYTVESIVQCIKELSVLGISGTLTSVRELLDNGYDKDQVIGWHLAKVMDVLDWEEQSVQSQVNLYKKETLDYNRWLKILSYIKAKKKLYEIDMSSFFNLDFGNSAQNNIDSLPVDLTSPRYQGTRSQYINVFLRMSAVEIEKEDFYREVRYDHSLKYPSRFSKPPEFNFNNGGGISLSGRGVFNPNDKKDEAEKFGDTKMIELMNAFNVADKAFADFQEENKDKIYVSTIGGDIQFGLYIKSVGYPYLGLLNSLEKVRWDAHEWYATMVDRIEPYAVFLYRTKLRKITAGAVGNINVYNKLKEQKDIVEMWRSRCVENGWTGSSVDSYYLAESIFNSMAKDIYDEALANTPLGSLAPMNFTKVELLYRIDSVLKFNELLPVERFILSKQLTTDGYGQVDNKFLEGKVVRKVYKTFVTDLYAVSHRDSSFMKAGASKEILSRESEMLEELKLKQSPWSLQDVFVNVTGGPDKVMTIVREMFPKYGQYWEIGIHDMPLSFRMFSQIEGDRLNVPPNEIKLRVKSIPQLHDIIESVRGQFGPGEIAYEFDGGKWTVSELAVIICYRIMFDIDTLAIL